MQNISKILLIIDENSLPSPCCKNEKSRGQFVWVANQKSSYEHLRFTLTLRHTQNKMEVDAFSVEGKSFSDGKH